MLRSLYSGISSLKNHQTRMDVVGNNIANVNTVGFKSSRVIFQDIYSQTLQPANAADVATGVTGSNPKQVGLGTALGAVDVLHTQGSTEYTGSPLDMSIDGDGFSSSLTVCLHPILVQGISILTAIIILYHPATNLYRDGTCRCRTMHLKS